MGNHYQKAIQHVRDNHRWSEAEKQVALERIGNFRCDITFASQRIADEISELMDEYGQDNDLEEDWWREFGDEDDVFFALGEE